MAPVLSALLRYGAARGATEIAALGNAEVACVRFAGADLRGPVVTHLLAAFDGLVGGSLTPDSFDVQLVTVDR
jgi:hypothetical protein